MRRLCTLLLAAAMWVGTVQAATIVLKDGSIVEGDILNETSTTLRVKTLFDVRSIKRRDIDKIFDADADTALSPGATAEFDALPAHVRALLNARADYKLAKYERVLERLDGLVDRPADAGDQSAILWLIIESHERLAHWDTAEELLEKAKEEGSYWDQIRAKAHLAIFKDNPRHDLRVVGKVFARNFLPQTLVRRSREADSLADVRLTTEALSEYCDQMLRHEKTSIQAMEDRMNLRATLEAIRELPKGVNMSLLLQSMPYYDDLLKAEKSIYKAQAVLPGYADAFVLNLVRAEAQHLFDVLGALFTEAMEETPYDLNLTRNPRTGMLSPDARREWQDACDLFLERTAVLVTVGKYLKEKTSGYPKELSTLRKLLDDLFERLTQMRQSVARRRNRMK